MEFFFIEKTISPEQIIQRSRVRNTRMQACFSGVARVRKAGQKDWIKQSQQVCFSVSKFKKCKWLPLLFQ